MQKTEKKSFGKATATALTAIGTTLSSAGTAFASNWIENVEVASDVGSKDPFTLLGGLIGVIIAIFKFVGIILVFMGLSQLLMGFNSENPDTMSRGSKTFIIGLCMVAIRFLLGPSVLGVIN